MFLAYLTLITALTISAVAIYYSVSGLAAIFAAAVIPIIIMGGVLETAKLVTAVWLHRYWNESKWWLKTYLSIAVLVLMFITSMGIFGFLSKAHIEQTATAGDNSLQIELLDNRISREQKRIQDADIVISQLDQSVQTLMDYDRIRGPEGAIAVRQGQKEERDSLNAIITEAQTNIAQLQDERLVLSKEQVAIEAEVGPIKYIAEFVYGQEADKNLLEEAVRWVIIVIIFVFDPLAVLLLIASQYTFEYHRKEFGLFGYKKEPDPNPEDDPELKKIEPEPDTFEDEWPEPDTETFAPPSTPEKPEEDKLRAPSLDFTLLQPSIDDMRNALKNWEESKKLLEDVEVSDENIPVSESEPEPELESAVETPEDLNATSRKTYQRILGSDYIIDSEGKSVHKDAFIQQHPELILQVDDGKSVSTNFGTDFPVIATKGDIFVRVDQMPNRVYKFMGHKWIEMEKDKSDSYLFDEEYIKHLISKIETGEYDIDLLSDKEKAQIEEYLQSNQASNG
jgi:hypothetical protein